MCFMYEQIAAHFNFAGEVTRWGSKYEMFGLAFAYYLLPLIITMIYCKVKMASTTRIIGLSASIVISLTFIGVAIFLIVRICNNGLPISLGLKERLALVITILGCIMFTLTHLCPFVDRQKFKNAYIQKYPKFILVGLWVTSVGITVGSVIINNYYSFLVLFVMLAIAVAFCFVAVAIIRKKHPELAKVKILKVQEKSKSISDVAFANNDINENVEGNTAQENVDKSEDVSVVCTSIDDDTANQNSVDVNSINNTADYVEDSVVSESNINEHKDDADDKNLNNNDTL